MLVKLKKDEQTVRCKRLPMYVTYCYSELDETDSFKAHRNTCDASRTYLTMFVGAAQEEHLPPTETHEASDDIAGDSGVGVADVRLVVDVVDGRRNLEGTLAVIEGGGRRPRDCGE